VSPWISQHFLNPAYFWPGVALVALPIIIHLINRLHFRRVRFAAMEFLLASEQKNRRRILLEQLLLLLLRIGLVLLLVALLARLVLDSSQLSLFQGAKSHHLVLLDDSGSMRDRSGETSAFDAAKDVVHKLVAEGANRPGTQKFTLLLASRADETLSGLTERDIDEALVDEVATRLDDLACTHQAVDLAAALESARARLVDDRTDLKHLHVVSDVRRRDWFDNKALAATLRALAEADVAVNLVRTVGDAHENLAVTDLSGAVEVAAAGVPVSFTARVANFGTREATDVRLGVAVDGRSLPMNLVLERVEAGQQVQRSFEVEFETAGAHRLHVSLENDALEQDDVRHLAVFVPNENPVLIIDGTPGAEQGLYIADALAADRSVTGFATTIDGPDYLRRFPLERFHLIYLVNVAELPADALVALEKFVDAGGGLLWFLGDAVRPAFYNDRLYRDGQGVFPARLGSAPRRLARDDFVQEPDVVVGEHPLFRILAGEENPFIDVVFVNIYFPLDEQWLAESRQRTGPEVLATLRDRQPLMLEHMFGKGRVVTCLTAAGPLPSSEGVAWNNWANGPGAPSYAVLQLDLAKHVARRDRALPQKTVGEPLVESFSRVAFRDDVEFVTPDNQVTQLKAVAVEDGPAEVRPAGDRAEPSEVRPLVATFDQTDAPGIYAVRLTTQDRQPQERLVAYNAPVDESRLTLASDEQVRAQVGDDVQLSIQPPGVLDWIRSRSPGQEIRWWLLGLLVLIGMCEQALACRLSYHPR
jgi:hypothetical protein